MNLPHFLAGSAGSYDAAASPVLHEPIRWNTDAARVSGIARTDTPSSGSPGTLYRSIADALGDTELESSSSPEAVSTLFSSVDDYPSSGGNFGLADVVQSARNGSSAFAMPHTNSDGSASSNSSHGDIFHFGDEADDGAYALGGISAENSPTDGLSGLLQGSGMGSLDTSDALGMGNAFGAGGTVGDDADSDVSLY